MPQKHGGTVPSRTASAGNAAPPTASTPRKGGGYYLDDGPGDNPPPDLALLPDAIPRVEKFASGANRPYNVFGVDYVPDLSGSPYRQRGVGSWYGRKFHGQRTSSGEIYDMYAMTAAHPTLPIPCYALVTNLQNGRSVIVRVNDRGPFLHNRVMDLSYAAAFKLGYMSSGSGMIEVEMLMPSDIAAGRIPATTGGLLASASASTPVASTTPVGAQSPLTIEALTASAPSTDAPRPRIIASDGPMPVLPAAPTIAPEAAGRSLPLSTKPDIETGPDLVASPDRQPDAVLPEIASGVGFYLQLGAFKGKAGADSFASHVARDLDPSVASKLQVSDGNGLYRVRLGPYARRADADIAAASLRAAIAQPVLVMPDSRSR
ncbi:MAG: septal ring lytic transglycosylase RlpA family protein [Burkholderiaceae bacterium]